MTDAPRRWYKGTWEPRSEISPYQTEFATGLRIPFLNSPYPGWYFRFGIIVNPDAYALWRGEIPTNEEIEVIAGVRDAYTDYFFPRPNAFRDEMEAFAPYDVEGGKPGRFFIKRPDGSWAYRVSTWMGRYEFFPDTLLGDAPMTLAEVIDKADIPGQVRVS